MDLKIVDAQSSLISSVNTKEQVKSKSSFEKIKGWWFAKSRSHKIAILSLGVVGVYIVTNLVKSIIFKRLVIAAENDFKYSIRHIRQFYSVANTVEVEGGFNLGCVNPKQ